MTMIPQVICDVAKPEYNITNSLGHIVQIVRHVKVTAAQNKLEPITKDFVVTKAALLSRKALPCKLHGLLQPDSIP
jgi:hypothetical protein